jgi:hypothetical protein
VGFLPFAPSSLPLSGGTLTGLLSLAAGSRTAGSAPVLTPANTNGAAAQLADHTRDYMLYLTVGIAGTALTVLIGPTVTPANTIYTAATATAGECISFRLPAGWFWQWSATAATLAQQFAVGC